MKLAKNILRIALIVFSVASIVLFFLPFATITPANGEAISITGAMMSFHGEVSQYNGAKLAVSADVWFCFILTAFTVLFSALTFKFKGVRWPSVVTSLASAIYMLVILLSPAANFVDKRLAGIGPMPGTVNYTTNVLFLTIALFVTFALAVAYLFTSDYVEVLESNGSKLPVGKRIINFFKDYKGEIKKVVWPGPREVVKNTLIVFAVCLIIGGFVWLVDFGLVELLKLIQGAIK